MKKISLLIAVLVLISLNLFSQADYKCKNLTVTGTANVSGISTMGKVKFPSTLGKNGQSLKLRTSDSTMQWTGIADSAATHDSIDAHRVILQAYINDSSKILHWADTSNKIATIYDLTAKTLKTLHSGVNDTLFSATMNADSAARIIIDYDVLFADATDRQSINGTMNFNISLLAGSISGYRVKTDTTFGIHTGTLTEDLTLFSYVPATHKLYVIVKYTTSLTATINKMSYAIQNKSGLTSIVYY